MPALKLWQDRLCEVRSILSFNRAVSAKFT